MLNRVILMGRLTATPELRETPNGISVTSFAIAVDRNFGKERQTDFINLVAWRQTAEFVSRYFAKGQMIAVEGTLQSRRFTDKDGNNRVTYEVVIDQAYFTGSKRESGVSETGTVDAAKPSQAAASAAPTVQDGQDFSVSDFNDLEGFEEIGTEDADLPF